MKRVLCLFLAMLGSATFAAKSGDFTYEVYGPAAIITDYSGSATEVTVPETLGGKPVICLEGTFRDNTKVKKVTLPKTLRYLDRGTFVGCTALEDVEMPKEMELAIVEDVYTTTSDYGETQEGVFDFCENLYVENGIRYSGKDKAMLLGVVDASAVDADATTGGIQVVIPEGVRYIPNYAFQNWPDGMNGFASLTLPESIQFVGANAFARISLEWDVQYGEDVRYIYPLFNGVEEEDEDADDYGNVYENLTDKRMVMGSAQANVFIPSSVRIIGEGAFRSLYTLASVTFAEDASVYHIGHEAFAHSTLPSIELPDSVRMMSESAFAWCSSLAWVKLPADLTNFTDNLFAGCASLTEIEWPANLAKNVAKLPTLNGSVFYCTGLTEVTVPDGICGIEGESTFGVCSALKKVSLPDGLMELDARTFDFSYALESITFRGAPPEEFNTPAIAEDGVSGTLKGYYTAAYAAQWKAVASKWKFPEMLPMPRVIGPFNYAVNKGKVTIVSYNHELDNMTEAGRLEIPEEIEGYPVTTLGEYSFCDVPEAITLVLPKTLTTIEECAVAYREVFKPILITYEVDPENAKFSSYQGALLDKAQKTILHVPQGVKRFEIPETVTTIAADAFAAELEALHISASVTKIGEWAFAECLTTFTVDAENKKFAAQGGALFDKSMKTLLRAPGDAVDYCVPDSVTKVGDAAFAHLKALTSVYFPSSVTALGEELFYMTESIAKIRLPHNLKTIPTCLCSSGPYNNLKEIVIPASVTKIDDYAFSSVYFDKVIFLGKPPKLGEWAFSSSQALAVPAANVEQWRSVQDKVAQYDESSPWGVFQRFEVMEEAPVSDFTVEVTPTEIINIETMEVKANDAIAKVTGVDKAYAFGKKATIKAAPANKKQHIFVGWYKEGEPFTEAYQSASISVYTEAFDHENFAEVGLLALEARFMNVDAEKVTITPEGLLESYTSDEVDVTLKIEAMTAIKKVTIKGLPKGMKFDAKTWHLTGLPTLPGAYPVAVTVTTAAKTHKPQMFTIAVKNQFNFAPTAPEASPVTFTPGETITAIKLSTTYTSISGLPAGMKWDKKSNSIIGKPTKPGTYVVVFGRPDFKDPKRILYAAVTYVVDDFPLLTVGADGKGTINKMAPFTGNYICGKKVTLKAAPEKGWLFCGWNQLVDDEWVTYPTIYGEYIDECVIGEVDYRNPSLPLVMPAEDIVLEACFVEEASVDAEIWREVAIYPVDFEKHEVTGPDEWDDNWFDEEVVVEPNTEIEYVLIVESETLPTVTAKGLPKGLKFNAKNFTITGKATVPGTYPVIVTVTNAQRKAAGLDPVSETFNLRVRNINTLFDAYYYGEYERDYGFEIDALDGAPMASLQDFITSYAPGKVNVTNLPKGVSWNKATQEFVGVPTIAGTYTITVTSQTDKKQSATITLHVETFQVGIEGDALSCVSGERTSLRVYLMADIESEQIGKVAVSGLPKGLTYKRVKKVHKYEDGDSYTYYVETIEGKTTAAPGSYPVTISVTDKASGMIGTCETTFYVGDINALTIEDDDVLTVLDVFGTYRGEGSFYDEHDEYRSFSVFFERNAETNQIVLTFDDGETMTLPFAVSVYDRGVSYSQGSYTATYTTGKLEHYSEGGVACSAPYVSVSHTNNSELPSMTFVIEHNWTDVELERIDAGLTLEEFNRLVFVKGECGKAYFSFSYNILTPDVTFEMPELPEGFTFTYEEAYVAYDRVYFTGCLTGTAPYGYDYDEGEDPFERTYFDVPLRAVHPDSVREEEVGVGVIFMDPSELEFSTGEYDYGYLTLEGTFEATLPVGAWDKEDNFIAGDGTCDVKLERDWLIEVDQLTLTYNGASITLPFAYSEAESGAYFGSISSYAALYEMDDVKVWVRYGKEGLVIDGQISSTQAIYGTISADVYDGVQLE